MQIRKWLALLVSAALALSLLAGCGGKNQSLAQVILDLLDGQYANVTVEIDPDLEADLRQAVHEGETDEEIRAALEKILGSGVSFRLIGDGQQGDSAWNLILYPGSDPDAAARSAFTEWNKVFGSLPRDGQYSAQIAMIETENGYAILVKATVDKAASRDDDDDDDEPEEPYSVEIEGDTLKSVTVNTSNGLENLFTKQEGEAKKIADARADGFAGVTIKLAAGSYSVDDTFNTPFKGILLGESPTNKATVTLQNGSNGLFEQIDTNGKVENITFDVQTAISNTYSSSKPNGTKYTRAGAVAGLNNGTITNCDVTINASGIAGENQGTISSCEVTINGGSITATNDNGNVYAGGIAGENRGTISNCSVKNGGDTVPDANDSADISAYTENGSLVYAGGIVGYNQGTDAVEDCSVSYCKIEAGEYGNNVAAGGIVGGKDSGSGNVNGDSAKNCYITATAGTYIFTATDDNPTDFIFGNGSVSAGTKIGYDWDRSEPVG